MLIFVVAGLTLLGSFLCSLFEAALYSLTPSQVELLKRSGRLGERIAHMRQDVDEPIAAILTINTITHTVGASACGALVGARWGSEAVGIFAAVFTVAVLLFTEIVPKSFGVRNAVTLAPLIAWPLQWMIWISWPVVKVSAWFMRLFSGGKSVGPSEEEVLVLSRLAARQGRVRPEEHHWVRNALLLDKVVAKDVMTPRAVVETLWREKPVGDLRGQVPYWVHSRLPVTKGQALDEVVGVALRKDVLQALVLGEDAREVGELMRPLHMVPESEPAHRLLDYFLKSRRHLVGVLDEYGTFQGIVTLEDVIEEMLGREIVDEYDRVEDMQAYARAEAERRRRGHTREGSPPPEGGEEP